MFRLRRSATALLILVTTAAVAADAPVRKTDVIYGRKLGTALTMDVFTPAKPNGAGVVLIVSGGWFSAHEMIDSPMFAAAVKRFSDRGYVVFAVVHGSQPEFQIPDAIADVKRAVRFVRSHAADYGVDPNRIGAAGASAGGHLSLMLGTAGDEGNPAATDPVDKSADTVQAVACFFPPTDFLNYGKPGNVSLGRSTLSGFQAPFQFKKFDAANKKFVLVTDEDEILRIGREISPVYHASTGDAPTLILHGDSDTLVPIQQANVMIDALALAGVETELVVRPGAGHGWATFADDLELCADWFDRHLAAKTQ